MKHFFVLIAFFATAALANEQVKGEEIEDRRYVACASYPSWHYKACQTPNQSFNQQLACKYWGLCRY